MEREAILLIAAIPLGYGVVLMGLAALVQPSRREMVFLARSMFADPKIDADARWRINAFLDSCMSFRVGMVVPLAVVSVIIDIILRRPRPPARAGGDARYHALVQRYFISILAANPLFALVSIPLIALSYVVVRLGGWSDAREAVEEPVARASGAAAPAASCAA